jgi:gamma-glutamylputrescine oxidase
MEHVPMPYLQISPWVTRPSDIRPPLRSDLRADVIIVGGGYTGLSTALALREEGIDVVLLEQDFAGAGASGRNAGHLTPTIGKDLPSMLRMFGGERASALVRFADQAVEHTESVIAQYHIDCDYIATGNVLAGVHPKHTERLRRAAAAGAELGAHVRFLPRELMLERSLPPAFLCGVLEERGGTLHPGRYVSGLRRAALAAGVRLYEETAVEHVDDGPPARVRVAGGSVVTADKVVLATNAYTPALGWKTRTLVPLRVSLFETEPLGEAQLAEIGWRGREGIYTAHEILESYRLTTRGTIVGGSKVVRFCYGSQLPPGNDPDAFRRIERAFRERFPQLHSVAVTDFWGGWIGFTLDFLPTFGVTGRRDNVHYGFGYAGHGVAQATFMGRILAGEILGRRHPSAEALTRRVRDWPREPIRWLAGSLLNGLLSSLDRRTDRQIRRLSVR